MVVIEVAEVCADGAMQKPWVGSTNGGAIEQATRPAMIRLDWFDLDLRVQSYVVGVERIDPCRRRGARLTIWAGRLRCESASQCSRAVVFLSG